MIASGSVGPVEKPTSRGSWHAIGWFQGMDQTQAARKPCVERAPRVATQFPALFRSDGFSSVRRAGEGMVLNLSRRGCMLRAETTLPIGTDLVLHLYRDTHPARIQIDQATV